MFTKIFHFRTYSINDDRSRCPDIKRKPKQFCSFNQRTLIYLKRKLFKFYKHVFTTSMYSRDLPYTRSETLKAYLKPNGGSYLGMPLDKWFYLDSEYLFQVRQYGILIAR